MNKYAIIYCNKFLYANCKIVSSKRNRRNIEGKFIKYEDVITHRLQVGS